MLTELRSARFKLFPIRTLALCGLLLVVDVVTFSPFTWAAALLLLLPFGALPALLVRCFQTRGVPPRAALRVLVIGGAAALSLELHDAQRDAVHNAAAPVIEAIDAYEARYGAVPRELHGLVQAGLLPAVPETGLLSPLHRSWGYYESTRRPHAHLRVNSSLPGASAVYCSRDRAWID